MISFCANGNFLKFNKKVREAMELLNVNAQIERLQGSSAALAQSVKDVLQNPSASFPLFLFSSFSSSLKGNFFSVDFDFFFSASVARRRVRN
jgi:hypothetical protein